MRIKKRLQSRYKTYNNKAKLYIFVSIKFMKYISYCLFVSDSLKLPLHSITMKTGIYPWNVA